YGGLQWQIISSTGNAGTLTAPTDGTGTYIAPSTASTLTLQLVVLSGPLQGQGPIYQINIVVPASGYINQHPGTGVYHVQNTASVGFEGDIFLQPTDVSFKAIAFQEGSAPGMCTGVFSTECGSHPATLIPVPIGNCNVTTGCKVLSNGNGPSDTIESLP